MRSPRVGLITLLFTLAVVGFSAPLSAQQGTVSGRVLDATTMQPINNVQVYVRGGAGVLTNAQGSFQLRSDPGMVTLIAEIIGYQNLTETVDVPSGGSVTVEILMTPDAVALTGLEITTNRTQTAERAIESPATTDIISNIEIGERATFNTADHLRSAPGVDVITTGLQNSNIVVRGFNNIFSGALHMLSDYRLAGVPSLRVNLMHFIPTIDEDIDRMEVVLGPGSALYGPNTANGVVHLISKSPLDDQGTTVTVGGGAKGQDYPSAFQGAFRSAFLLSDDFGVKISGQYLNAEEWKYIDPGEVAAQQFADNNQATCVADKLARGGISQAEAQTACGRIGDRSFDIKRWSFEARADWQYTEDGRFVATYGRNTSSGIELTGLGAGQTDEWVYDFFQARISKGRLFAQGYLNQSNSGNSFLLGDGVTLIDDSSLLVGQLQHGFELADGRQDFTYGVDYFGTNPASGGRIYGIYEDEDEMDEWGVYVQSKTALSPQFDLIVAGRLDNHSILAENVFSPRAALVFKPDENHGIRFTYNQAYSAPSALNFFLDVGGGFAPDENLAALGFTTRAFGSGPDGWSLRGPDNTFEWMRSPLTPAGLGGPAELVPAQTPLMWQYYVGVLQGSGAIDAGTAALLGSLTPTNSDIGRLALDPATGGLTPIEALNLPDLPPTLESNTETYELGWTGVIDNRVSIAADVYYTKKNNFVSPLLIQTPLLLLNPQDIETYLTPVVGPTNAAALAQSIPVGVVSSNDVGARGADLILSYRNVGDIDLYGGDISLQAFLTDEWSLSATYSHVSDDTFEIEDGDPIALNAPSNKGSIGLAYRNLGAGFNASSRLRFTGTFPASSAGFTGDVESTAIVDLTAGYAVPGTAATLQLSVTNVFNSEFRSFVGVPDIGRFTMLRVKYDLF